ncbi:hypothetical protein [Aquitalea sp. LB_tupeE]|uniref:hypothetical protein n=1 Tax=Aquitalea sp. LB_tupeE TaxID=2748078 RepID=UPI001C4C4A28|nr:hypothetical protein [Aquitalea sp. LB_tupeE]
MDTIQRRVRVTIERELTIELPADFASDDYLQQFCDGLWDIDGIDDVFCYAAEMAVTHGSNSQHDGLGWICEKGIPPTRPIKVWFDTLSDDCDCEIITHRF